MNTVYEEDGSLSQEWLDTLPPAVLRERVSASVALAYLKGELSDLELLRHQEENDENLR